MVRIMSMEAVGVMISLGREVGRATHLVSIRDTYTRRPEYDAIDASDVFAGILPVMMDDVRERWRTNHSSIVVPNEELVGTILDWARYKDDVAVHCTAGVSRSSAVAMLIDLERDMDLDRVLRETFNRDLHAPNELILEIGFTLLGCYPDAMDAYVTHLRESRWEDEDSIYRWRPKNG